MKKPLVLIFSIFCGKVFALENVSIADNDYELVCKYDDRVELTITQKGVYLVNTSIGISNDIYEERLNYIKKRMGTNIYLRKGKIIII